MKNKKFIIAELHHITAVVNKTLHCINADFPLDVEHLKDIVISVSKLETLSRKYNEESSNLKLLSKLTSIKKD